MIALDVSFQAPADSRFAGTAAGVSSSVRDAIVRGLAAVASEARANVAALRDPGRPSPSPLADSIVVQLADDGMSGEVVAGGETAPYAPYVEFGTLHMAAQPFLGPALAANAARLREDIAKAANAGLGDRV